MKQITITLILIFLCSNVNAEIITIVDKEPFIGQILSEQKLIASDGSNVDLFGCSVSISGGYAIIGAKKDDNSGDNSGSAYIFKKDNLAWIEQQKILASDGMLGDNFGFSVSISGDYAIVGANKDNDNGTSSGSAYIFKRNSEGWVEQKKLLPSDGSKDDEFGHSVSIYGDWAVVGAPYDNGNAINSGSAYVFKLIGEDWIEQKKLLASDGYVRSFFGGYVSITGEYALISATGDSLWAGSVYVFKRDKDDWIEQENLLASDRSEFDNFGSSVSISGDYAIIGALAENNIYGEDSGAAYIFKRDGNTWVEQSKILASDGAAHDYFGCSVSISGDYAVVGAHGDDDKGNWSGSTYIFVRDGETWIEQKKMLAYDGSETDFFGSSVSISEDHVIIGASEPDSSTPGHGYAYIYLLHPHSPILTISSTAKKTIPVRNGSFSFSLFNTGDKTIDMPWTASTDADWLTIDHLSGTGDSLLTVYYSDSEGFERTATITITAEGAESSPQTITLTQTGVPVLSVSPLFEAVSYVNGSISFTIANNGSEKMSWTSSTDADWISIDRPSGTGDRIIAINYTTNTGPERIAKITITADGAYDSPQIVTLKQAATPVLSVLPLSETVSYASGTLSFSITIRSPETIGWIAETNADWLSIDNPSGTGDSTFSVHYSANVGPERIARISFTTDAQDSSPQIITVTQKTIEDGQLVLASDGAEWDKFGTTVSISGNYAIVGSPYDVGKGDSSGSVYFYKRDGYTWVEQSKLMPSDNCYYFGCSVSISGDYAIVGAKGDDDEGHNSGSAYIFKRDGDSWVMQDKITNYEYAEDDYFGQSVSISEDRVIIGSAQYSDNDFSAAFIFKRNYYYNNWIRQEILLASDRTEGDKFGFTVSISGNYAVVGAYRSGDNGSAYIFELDESVLVTESWEMQAKLLSSDVTGKFGYSVSIYGDWVIVGASGDDDNGYASGAAYIFRKEGNEWTEKVKLLSSDGEKNDNFGCTVSIYEDWAIIGASGDDGTGSAYLFKRDGENWIERKKLLAFDGAKFDKFGNSVSISGDSIIVGANEDDDNGTGSGSSYIYFLQSRPILTLSYTTGKILPAKSGSFSLSIVNTGNKSIDMPWTATTTDDWITIDSPSGNGDSSLSVSYSENIGYSRITTITVAAMNTENSPQTFIFTQAGESILSVSPVSKTVSEKSGALSVNITNNGYGNMDWKAATDEDWLTIDNSSGTGDSILTVNYSANRGSVRIATITVTAEGAKNSPQFVTLTQTGPSIITVSPISETVSHANGTLSISITNSGTKTMKWNAANDSSWLTIDKHSGTGDSMLNVNYSANTGAERLTTITITAEGAKNSPQTFTLMQTGAPILSVTPLSETVSYESGVLSVNIFNSNPPGVLSWTASTDADWLFIDNPSGTGNKTLTMKYTTNTGDERIAIIIVTGKGAENSPQVITLTQTQAPILSVSNLFPTVAHQSGSLSVFITNIAPGSINWNATTDYEWITLDHHWDFVLNISYSSNIGNERIATITITAEDAQNSPQIIKLTQAGVPILTVSPINEMVTYSSGKISVSIINSGSGTMPWAATTDVDWLTIDNCVGTGDSTLTVNYSANAGPERIATITIEAEDTMNSPLSITITQSGNPTLSVSPLSEIVSYANGVLSVSITNNSSEIITWEATTNSNWLTIDNKTGAGDGILNINYLANKKSERIATITIIAEDAMNSPLTVTLTQIGFPILSVLPLSKKVSHESSTLSFSITNSRLGVMKWSATADADWLTVVNISGIGDSNLIVNYSANTGPERIATITITAEDAINSPQVITVIQDYEWAEQKLLVPDGASYDKFGCSVSINGEYAIIGASKDDDNGDNSGAAYIFRRDSDSWIEQAKLLASDGSENDNLGFSVSISGDYVIVGSNNGESSGASYIFKRDGDRWIEQAKLIPSDGARWDFFGYSVSISGDYAIIGAYFDDRSGSAYIFKRDAENWIQLIKLVASDIELSNNFGCSVSISGDYAIVGSPGDDDNGEASGSAYIFKRDGDLWIEQVKLLASDGAYGDLFGNSVSISSDYALIGAYKKNDKGENSGSAYIFKRNGDTWIEQTKLLASDGAKGHNFGNSVSINGFCAIISAQSHENKDKTGSAYIFKRKGDIWVEQKKIISSDGYINDSFGYSVSISENHAIVGTYKDGSAYIYPLPPYPPMLTLYYTTKKLPATSGTFSFSIFNSGSKAIDMPWVATTDADWLTIDNPSGTGDSNLKISYSANEESERIATITVTAEGAENSPQTISVFQKITEVAGDVNGDGVVDLKDLLSCQKVIAGMKQSPPFYMELVDFNGNGKLDVGEQYIVLKIISGI